MDNFYYCKFQHIYFLVDLKVFLFENEEKKESRIIIKKFKRQLEVEEVLVKIAKVLLGDKI